MRHELQESVLLDIYLLQKRKHTRNTALNTSWISEHRYFERVCIEINDQSGTRDQQPGTIDGQTRPPQRRRV
jgi:hypothetical protein